VSSALVALGFIGQISDAGETFELFSLAVIPVLFWLGLLTFIRVLEKSIEDLYVLHERRTFTRAFAHIDVAFPSA
jgi:hypothetical protein